jgi:hypothetical protein
LQILLKTDNVGAMFMAQNSSPRVRTRHVNAWYQFVRENPDEGIIKIEFNKSVENQSDIYTNNVTQEIYERHVQMILEEYIKGKFNGLTFQYGKDIGNILYVQAKLIRIFISNIEDLRDQPITGYGDAYNEFNSF